MKRLASSHFVGPSLYGASLCFGSELCRGQAISGAGTHACVTKDLGGLVSPGSCCLSLTPGSSACTVLTGSPGSLGLCRSRGLPHLSPPPPRPEGQTESGVLGASALKYTVPVPSPPPPLREDTGLYVGILLVLFYEARVAN